MIATYQQSKLHKRSVAVDVLNNVCGRGLHIFWATVCKTVHLTLSDGCLSCLSVLSCLPVTLVYCGQTV